MSRQWRQCRITQTLIRVFVRGHKMRAAHPSSPLSFLFPPSFQPFSPLSFPVLPLFYFFFTILTYWCLSLCFLFVALHSDHDGTSVTRAPSPRHHAYFNLSSLWPLPSHFYYRHEIQRQHNFYCFPRSL